MHPVNRFGNLDRSQYRESSTATSSPPTSSAPKSRAGASGLGTGRSAAGHEDRRLCEAGPGQLGREERSAPPTTPSTATPADAVMNELDEYAIEEALQLEEAHGGEVTSCRWARQRATETIRKALSMGADSAVHVVDDALHGSDALATSAALAAALERAGFDLVILGSESTDARMSRACRRCSPSGSASAAADLRQQGRGRRRVDHHPAADRLRLRRGRGLACRPSSASSRRSTSRATRRSRGSWRRRRSRSRRSAWPTLGVDAGEVGLAAAGTEVVELRAGAAPRRPGTIVTDDGDGGVKIAEFLAAQKFI